MHKLSLGKKDYRIAQSFNELSLFELCYLHRLMRVPDNIQAVKTKMMAKKLGVKFKHWGHKKHKYRIDGVKGYITSEQVAMLTTLYDFMFTEPDENGHSSIDSDLCQFPIVIDTDKANDPGFALSNLNYGQYQYITTFLAALPANPVEALDGILVTLFVKGITDMPSFPDISTVLGKHIKHADLFRTLALWYVIGSMKYLKEKFPKLFSGTTAESVDPFLANMEALEFATDGDVSKRDAVRNANLYDVLHSINAKLKKSEK